MYQNYAIGAVVQPTIFMCTGFSNIYLFMKLLLSINVLMI